MSGGEEYVLSGYYGSRWAWAVPMWPDAVGRFSDEFPEFVPFVLQRDPRRGEIVIGSGQVTTLIAEGRVGELPFPVRFRRTNGTRLGDLLWAGGLGAPLASQRLIDVLVERGASGWCSYPIEILQPRGGSLEGYAGFVALPGSGDVRREGWSGEIIVSAAIDRALREAGVTLFERRRYVSEEPDIESAQLLRLEELDPEEESWFDPRSAELVTGDSPHWFLDVTAPSDAAQWCPWWDGATQSPDGFWRVAYDLVSGGATSDAPADLHLRRSGAEGEIRDLMTSPEPSMLPLFVVSDRLLAALEGFTGWGSRPIDLIDGDRRIRGHHVLWAGEDLEGVHDVTGMEQVDIALADVLPVREQPGEHEIAGAELWQEIRAKTRWALPEPRFRVLEFSPAVLRALQSAGVTGFDVRPTWSRSAQWTDLERSWNDPERAVIWQV